MRQIQYKKVILYPILDIGFATLLSANTIDIKDGESYFKDIDTKSGENILNFLGGSGSYKGAITANGGDNRIVFGKDGTFTFEASLIANGVSTNTLKANHNITLRSNITLNGTSNIQSAGNIFKIMNKTLALRDDEEILKMLEVKSGFTHLKFEVGQSNFIGNINALGGDIAIEVEKDTKATLLGDVILQRSASAKIILGNSSSLTLKGSYTEIDSIVSKKNERGNIILDGANSKEGVELIVNRSLEDENITFSFNGSYDELSFEEKKAELILKGNNNTIKQITLGDNSLCNVLDFKNGNSSITSQIFIQSGQELSLNFWKNTELTLSSGIENSGHLNLKINDRNSVIAGNITTSNKGETNIYFGGFSNDSIIEATIGLISNNGENASTNFILEAEDVVLRSGDRDKPITFLSGSNAIFFNNQNNSILDWQSLDGIKQTITTDGGKTFLVFTYDGIIKNGIHTSNGKTTIAFMGKAKATFQQDITTTQKGKIFVDFARNSGKLVGNIITDGEYAWTTINLGSDPKKNEYTKPTIEGNIITKSGVTFLQFSGSNNKLTIKGNAEITTVINSLLIGGKGNGVSLYYDGKSVSDGFKTLTIGKKGEKNGLVGENLSFVVYAMSNQNSTSDNVYADKIIIHSANNRHQNGKNRTTTHFLGVKFENQDTIDPDSITYTRGANNNILVASVANDSGVILDTSKSNILGFDVATISYTLENDGEYTNYYVGGIKDVKIAQVEQEVASSALLCNYDLYFATFNSLNKRMGELRDNIHNHGVWARISHGIQNNDFGLGSKTSYSVIQSGYDYSFTGGGGKEEFNDYLGIALSYAFATSNIKKISDHHGEQRSVKNIKTQAIEVALYNAYIQNEGWYNDSLLKLGYFVSSFAIYNLNQSSFTNNQTQNIAVTLNDEMGYQFKLGELREWSVTPQIELGFGYLNQSRFKQKLKNSSAYLDSLADDLFTFRTKIGSSFGYDFKRFTQKFQLSTNLYTALFYEYDYIGGGKIHLNTQRSTQTKDYFHSHSDNRFVINLGCNLSIQDNTKIYFDFEKSFGGKITTEYQINLGIRYGFGNRE